MAINLETHINTTLIAMGVDQVIVRDNIGNNIGLVEKEVEEGNCVIVPLRAVHGGNDGVAGEDGGTGVGEHRVASDSGGGVEVAGADEGLHAVVEVEAGTHKGRGGVGEARGVGVARGWRMGVSPESMERRLDAEAALAAAALGGSFLSGGEGEGAAGEESMVGVRVGVLQGVE